jgi:hypothetical protein
MVQAMICCGRTPMNKALRYKPILHLKRNRGHHPSNTLHGALPNSAYYGTIMLIDCMGSATCKKLKLGSDGINSTRVDMGHLYRSPQSNTILQYIQLAYVSFKVSRKTFISLGSVITGRPKSV